jgi:hypothetical protein
MKSWLALSASVLLVLPQAHAAEVLRSANSGQPTLVRRYFSWNSITCAFKSMKVDVTAQPLHGKIEPKFGGHVLAAADVREGDIALVMENRSA